MSNGGVQNSLDNLAHIANMSHELQVLNQQIKEEAASPSTSVHGGGMAGASNSSTPPPSLNKSGKIKRMACVECRQQKSRCDASQRYPEPCTRCAKKGLLCDLKSDYKRTYKRARIAQIEKEFSDLKKTLTPAQAAELFSKVPSLNTQNTTQNTTTQGSTGPLGPNTQGNTLGSLHSLSSSIPGLHSSSIPSLAAGSPGVRIPIRQVYSPYPYINNQNHQNQHQNHQNHQNHQQYGQYNSHGSHDPNFSNSPRMSNSSNTSIPNTPSIHRPLDESFQPITHHTNYTFVCEEKVLDSVSLSSETIKMLYIEYIERYHQILPVVDILLGPERIYKLCPALFWVIMFVSLRRFNDDSQKSLLLQLSPLVKGVLAEIMISPISRYNPVEEDEPIFNALSVYSVQAFLLYSFWPPITSSLSADSSYNTIGNALFQAIRIGLHSPGLAQTEALLVQENSKTWILCNIVCQTIATSFGFPAFVQFDTSIWTTSTSTIYKLPPAVKYMMELANFEDQVAKTLNTNPMDPYGLINSAERLPILKLLLRRLDEIEINMNLELSNDDGFRRFQLYSARVHLLTYYFMDSSLMSQFELQSGLIKLFNAAITLINHTQSFQQKDPKFVKYLPGVYILDIWQAACIIGKLIHSSMRKLIDTGSGKQSYEIAISLAAKASIMKHDMAHRSSGIMRNMWQLFRTLHEKNLNTLNITIRNRMSASVFFDCLFLLRDQVGMIKLNSKNDVKNPDEVQENSNDLDDIDDDLNEDNDDAVASEHDEPQVSVSHDGSQKSTPGSSTSSSNRRKRSLSNTVNAESRARKIIRTIPFDPRPISSASGERSSIFKVVNNSNESSPRIRSDASPNSSISNQPNHQSTSNQPNQPNTSFKSPGKQSYSTKPYGANKYDAPSNLNMLPGQESPLPLSLESFDMNSDLLWKDVDSVMNDFGFHTT